MAFRRELPHSFGLALKVAKEILSTNSDLVAQNLVDTEAEQLVLASYREATGNRLSRIDFYSKLQDPFPPEAGKRTLILAGSRAEGKLLQHLTGFQTFLEHDYEVGPDVLIPRPETEVLLTSVVIELLSQPSPPQIGLEIGIGSGVLSIELLCQFPQLKMFASELSQPAMERAKKNALRILGQGAQGEGRLTISKVSDPLEVWDPFESELRQPADFVITNPPYLTQQDEIQSQVLAYEPAQALFAPAQDPLYFYRVIAQRAQIYLKPRGFVFAELPHERSLDILGLFVSLGWDARSLPDLNRRDRVLIAQLN